MKKLRLFALIVSVLIALTGCSNKTIPDLDKLRSDDGTYTFQKIEWGTKPGTFFELTGWEQPAEPITLYDDESGEVSFYFYRISEIEFADAKWEADVQFDPNDELWAVSLMQSGEPKKMQKQFQQLDEALTNLYGEPDSANYDMTNELSGDVTANMDNVSWHVLKDGTAVNVLALGYVHIEGQDKATVTLTPKWNDEGFAIE